jgi:hypothetical protein
MAMRIKVGAENKGQVKLFIALAIALIMLAVWEFHDPSPVHSTAAHANSNGQMTAAQRLAAKQSNGEPHKSRFDFALRLNELSRSETFQYANSGRNVFAVAPPVVIETPVASPRVAIDPVPAVIEPPKPPSMDLKYLGYAQGSDKILSALFIHGEDIFMAKSGDIMFHRFQVGAIQPASVQVTDLRFKNTQTIAVVAN